MISPDAGDPELGLWQVREEDMAPPFPHDATFPVGNCLTEPVGTTPAAEYEGPIKLCRP